MKRFIGVDLHKKSCTVCYLKEDGERVIKSYNLRKIGDFIVTLQPEDELALEACNNSLFFLSQVRHHVHVAHLIDPGQFKVIARSVKKTDEKDAALLALFLSKGMLPLARQMDDRRARLKSLVGTRDRLVKTSTLLKNKVHSVLSAQGMVVKKTDFMSQVGLDRILTQVQDEGIRFEVEILVDHIRHLEKSLKKLEDELKKPDQQLPSHASLASIKGIGPVGAAVLSAVIGDIEDFQDADHLASYFGLVPRVYQSGDRQVTGRITKRGSKLGRAVLVQCTWTAIRYSPRLKAYYTKLRSKKNAGKAIIATARKFLAVIFFTLQHQIIWDNFPEGIIKSQGHRQAA
jgi:transposase